MRRIILLVFLGSLFYCSQAQRYKVQSAEIDFTSNAELELIKASTKQIRGLLDTSTNQFAFSVEIKSFIGFNSGLQREHFNEKYLESPKFPKATFSGKIIEAVDFSIEGTYNVRAKGELDIHGQKQTRIIKGKIVVKKSSVRIEVEFFVPLSDHNITIPSIVSQKIATEIVVIFSAELIPE